MLLVQDKLVHLDVIKEEFACNLGACRGACCWEGDFGAPIQEEEKEQIENILAQLLPRLSEESQSAIKEQGPWKPYPTLKEDGTPLLKNGACAYLIWDDNQIAKCGFEILFNEGLSSFKKPISCHLYPIRINHEEAIEFEAVNYDRWSICTAACDRGKDQKIPLYKFCEEAIIRKYGIAFFDELDDIAKALKNNESL